MRLVRVISGGQTGADRAALVAAKAAGLATGGWMPKGFLAHDGERPEFASLYGLREHESPRYPPRTALNVKESDATLRFATDWASPGEVLTLKMIERYGRPHLDVTPGGGETIATVVEWLGHHDPHVLNVAGNSERTSPGIEAFVTAFLAEVFAQLVRPI
ncbi:putative molybdenum carrier protein [Gemmata sp. JC673]|uniref:Molybdenum carrier protein n=1 Tax=Gemmata algarum TaxID=2975278 RepID=A0ABU5EXF3_9BACT|nr:putative molybdenum carrier protein [Gemmata algarum]MDY3559929.1 putative molybdenum carrier protein [Gemmata algarum]